MASSKPLLKVKLDTSGRTQPSLAAILSRALSPAAWKLLQLIVTEAEQGGAAIYLVGGFVRDLLLGVPSLDLDLVFEGDAIRLGRTLCKRYGGRLVSHAPFGTAVWWLPADSTVLLRRLGSARGAGRIQPLPEFIDLISARSESYVRPAALPAVQLADITADQYRRDFTINTLALRLDSSEAGRLLDPWQALPDLKAGILRTLHPRSFSDDPTRILRILRFVGRLRFKVEAKTQQQLKASLPGLALVSGERLRNELDLVLVEKQRIKILQSMQRLAVLRHIHPKLRFPAPAAGLLNRAGFKPAPDHWDLQGATVAELGYVFWFMQLAPNQVADLCERLRFNVNLKAATLSAARLRAAQARIRGLSPSRLVAHLEKEPPLAIYALYLANKNAPIGRLLESYAKKWRHVHPLTDGNLLRKKGLHPGPAYKLILSRLRAARLDGEVRTAKQESVLLEKLLDEHR